MVLLQSLKTSKSCDPLYLLVVSWMFEASLESGTRLIKYPCDDVTAQKKIRSNFFAFCSLVDINRYKILLVPSKTRDLSEIIPVSSLFTDIHFRLGNPPGSDLFICHSKILKRTTYTIKLNCFSLLCGFFFYNDEIRRYQDIKSR